MPMVFGEQRFMIKIMKQNTDGTPVSHPINEELFVLLKHYQLIFLCIGTQSKIKEDQKGNVYKRNSHSI